MESTYFTFSPYPSTIQEFVVDGVRRGEHYIMHDVNGRTRYCARLHFDRDLPAALLTTSPEKEHARFGPEHPLEGWPTLTARSDAFPFPRDLVYFALQGEGEKIIEGLKRRTIMVETRPDSEQHAGSQLNVDIWLKNEKKDLENAITLSRFLCQGAARVADEDRRYQDAFEVLGKAEGPGEPPKALLDDLREKIARATHWVSGNPMRVQNAMETRLTLTEVGSEMQGTLFVHWRDPAIGAVDVFLDGQLPKVADLHITMAPEEPGFWGFIQTLGELEIGERSIDDAFFIKVLSDKKAARTLLLHASAQLKTLAAHGAHVTFETERLKVRIGELGDAAANIESTCAAVLELWRKTLLYCAGFSGESDPYAPIER